MEAINLILAQSITKVNAFDTLNKEKISCSSTASAVYQYLRTTSPVVADLLLDVNPEIDTSPGFTIEDVVNHWKMKKDQKEVEWDLRKVNEENVNTKLQESGCSNVKRVYRFHSLRPRPYTPKEDEIIRSKIEKLGNALRPAELSKELGRPSHSVKRRIKILTENSTTGDVRKRSKRFSLLEDELILEKVLPILQNKKLKDIVLQESSFKDLSTAIGRSSPCSVYKRWSCVLQPWIMQYETGTLNFDIRQMLINHLSETYSNRESIRWDIVAKRPEFAGHTEISLRHTFAVDIIGNLRSVLQGHQADGSLKQTAVSFKEYMDRKHRGLSESIQKRQFNVIEYYKRFVRKYNTID